MAKKLLDIIPAFQKLQADVIIPFAKKRDHGRLVKSVIKKDIEGRINSAILAFGNELPRGWINRMQIEWVENESRNDFFNDGEMVLRICPLKDETENLVHACYAFLQKAFFPRAKNVIPKEHREAAVLFVGRKIMTRQGDGARMVYEDIVLEPAIQRNKRILPLMPRYKTLDARGFFMGAFLREVHAVAIGARFDAVVRDKMREEASALLDHMEEFIAHYSAATIIPEALWSRRGPITNYAFLLVARPGNVKTGNIKTFVEHARESLKKGIDRLYVFGAEEHRPFVINAINAIEQQVPEYEVSERFNLSNDYRGQAGGLGALFVRRD